MKLASWQLSMIALTFFAALPIKSQSDEILKYSVEDGTANPLGTFFLNKSSGKFAHEWFDTKGRLAATASFDGSMWWVARYRTDEQEIIYALAVCHTMEDIDKNTILIRSNRAEDADLQLSGPIFSEFCPLEIAMSLVQCKRVGLHNFQDCIPAEARHYKSPTSFAFDFAGSELQGDGGWRLKGCISESVLQQCEFMPARWGASAPGRPFGNKVVLKLESGGESNKGRFDNLLNIDKHRRIAIREFGPSR